VRRREDCDSAKQRYGNRDGVDTVCDFRFHSALGELLILPVPSEIFVRRGKKI
jgi:hypothetical protein